MKLHPTVSIALCTAGLLAAAIGSAQAAEFSFTTRYSGNLPTEDIFLDSIALDNNRTIGNFSLVNRANILFNDRYTGGDTGGASSDLGDQATVGLAEQAIDNADVVASLGNRYLSSILDSEDFGKFSIDLGFDSPVSNLLFWERGGNSKLDLQAIDSAGNPIGQLITLSSDTWQPANFTLDTTEIDSAQPVRSIGIRLSDLGVSAPISSIRVTSNADYNGADFKVVGTASVPEPGMIAGLAIAGGLLLRSRRGRGRSV
ncbi:PEP-CTERM sorting domain-containing protein [Microcoleus sp. FACHB-1515]|uniref:exosortase-dependent surface protein XDP2 n=1 Tax=Cyanophyceae TaxID=3028117 RepID=UPI0016840164|nr:exosortase-dependent surface protein XDP2 [Microcoleus sp. FACHB-1515]MBD2089762.1 PEP-CTERM sorting domain-containing protein [Microcoleus sp. FACHB-1515]